MSSHRCLYRRRVVSAGKGLSLKAYADAVHRPAPASPAEKAFVFVPRTTGMAKSSSPHLGTLVQKEPSQRRIKLSSTTRWRSQSAPRAPWVCGPRRHEHRVLRYPRPPSPHRPGTGTKRSRLTYIPDCSFLFSLYPSPAALPTGLLCISSVALLPQELTCSQKRGSLLNFPPDDTAPPGQHAATSGAPILSVLKAVRLSRLV